MDKMYVGEIVEWESGILAIVLRIVGIFSFIICLFFTSMFLLQILFCVTIVISNKKHKMLTIIKSTS